MKYIKLPNGTELEFYNYAITNSLIIKFLNSDFNMIDQFFGSSTIQYIDILDENKNLIEHKDLGGMKCTSLSIENSTITKTEQLLISESYDEIIEVNAGNDNDGNDIYEKKIIRHEAVYEPISKKIPVKFIVAVLERPSFEEQINEVKKYTGMIDTSALDLNGWKNYKQEENKRLFSDFLQKSFVAFHNKQYGVTKEDQSEMSLNYMQYIISKQAGGDSVLEWHAKKEKCIPFTEQEFLTLYIMIKSFVCPYMNRMQTYKEQIYACKSIDEVKQIKINYSSEV